MAVFGTRPEAIKMAPVVHALRKTTEIDVVVTVTAQHRSMLDQVLELFEIIPEFDLGIIEDRQTLTSITTKALTGLEPILRGYRPDMVVVQGDTTSTFAGALASFYQRIPVAHVEAGLRTGNPNLPYPEEINRRLTSRLAALHFSPTAEARDNLLAEGVSREHIVVTGNTVIDALLDALRRRTGCESPVLTELDSHSRPVLLVTTHRRESWGEPMRQIGLALADIARAEPEVIILFPVHRNPVVREVILPCLQGLRNVQVIEPLDYGDFVRLMARSTLVLTDSGGIQEEAPSLGKPVLVLRATTERPEAVRAGTVRLVGTDRTAVRDAALNLLRDPSAYEAMAKRANPYGDGHAARRIATAICRYFGTGDHPPDEFRA